MRSGAELSAFAKKKLQETASPSRAKGAVAEASSRLIVPIRV